MEKNTYKIYSVGGCSFRIEGESFVETMESLSSFQEFEKKEEKDVQFVVQRKTTEELPTLLEKKLFECHTKELSLSFYKLENRMGNLAKLDYGDGKCFYVWSEKNRDILYLSGSFSPGTLSLALRLGYGMMTCLLGKIVIHSSCIVHSNRAFLFLGESGTGKSTHTALWKKYIPNSFLLNDDSPIISIEGDEIWVYGSPWSGKTPCYKAERYPIGGIVRLSQAPFNRITRLNKTLKAYCAIHPSCAPELSYDETLYDGISNTLGKLIAHIPFFHLECLPNEEAALMSFNALFKK